MAKERRKIVRAGRLWMAVQYTAIRGGSQSQKREARAQISSPAREALNAKYSWQKLMMLLAANFISSDLVVTLTYRDENLPQRREDAEKRMDNFIRALRKYRRSLIPDVFMPYVRVLEGQHSGGRYHHHLIVSSTGDDYEMIKQLWAKNGDNVDFELFGDDGPERWGKYLTKETREKGRRYVGDRTWKAAIHMKKPTITSYLVDPGDRLEAPAGSHITDRTECENCYGRFSNIMAVLPEQAK